MARIPSRDEILEWISENPSQTSKRDIAKAFGIKGAGRIDLKRMLKELEGCDMHSTHVIGKGDENGLRKLRMNVTTDLLPTSRGFYY